MFPTVVNAYCSDTHFLFVPQQIVPLVLGADCHDKASAEKKVE